MWRLGLGFRRQLSSSASCTMQLNRSYGFIPKLIEHTWSGEPDYDDILKDHQFLFISPPVRFICRPLPAPTFLLLRIPHTLPSPRFYPEPPSLPRIPHTLSFPSFYKQFHDLDTLFFSPDEAKAPIALVADAVAGNTGGSSSSSSTSSGEPSGGGGKE